MDRLVAAKSIDRQRAMLRLLVFADECCGSYYRDGECEAEGAYQYDDRDNCTRFTDADALLAYIDEVGMTHGKRLARMIAPHVIDLSGSPMETYVNHALTLPPRFGGLSMKSPLANKQLVVEESKWRELKHALLRPDMQWPDYNMLVEYLGDKEHAGKPARLDDKNRMQDYATAQYTAYPLMYDDVRNVAALDSTAQMLAGEFVRRGLSGELDRIRKLLRNEDFWLAIRCWFLRCCRLWLAMDREG